MIPEDGCQAERVIRAWVIGAETDERAGKKTLEIRVEQDREVKHLLETAKVLAGLLAEHGSGRREEAVVCGCGRRMESQGVRSKPLLTILGPVAYQRSMFMCPACRSTRYPGDEALDMVGTTRSPGLRRMMPRAGSQSTFKDGRDDLRIYAGVEVSAKDVERVAERIGQEMDTRSRDGSGCWRRTDRNPRRTSR